MPNSGLKTRGRLAPSDDGASRFDRVEKPLELLVDDHVKLVDEHKLLLRAQVVLTEKVDKLADVQRHTDERFNALISVVDDLVRRPPPSPPLG